MSNSTLFIQQIKNGFKPIFRKDILISSFVLNMLALAMPMVLLQVYDRIIPNTALGTLSLLIIGLGVVLILDVTLRTIRGYLTGWIGAKFEHDATGKALDTILSADLNELEKISTGEHLDRITSIDSVRDFYSSQAGLALIDLPFVFLFLGLLGYIGGALLLVPVLLLIILSVISFYIGVKLKKAIEEDVLWEDRRYSFIIEVLRGIHSVKSMAMENLMNRRYERMMESCSKASYNVIHMNNIAQSVGNVFSQITLISVASIGSILVIQDNLSMGALAASTMLAGRTVQPLLRALGIWTRFQHIQIAQDKLQQINDLRPERSVSTKDLKAIESIEMKDFTFRYQADGPDILKNINLKLNHGDIISIKGGNSSGKSTLLWALMNGLTSQKGELLINGKDPKKFSTQSIRHKIAYLPQSPVMFQGSILDNLTMFEGDDKIDKVMKYAKLLDLNHVLAKLPEGFETQLGASTQDELPAGITQRIAIARALANEPDIILFDEANNGLDNKADHDLMELIKDLKGTCTIVLISYRPSLLKLADRHYELVAGELKLLEDTVISTPETRNLNVKKGEVVKKVPMITKNSDVKNSSETKKSPEIKKRKRI